MYLLRFGLFILSASVSSALSLHPLKVLGGLAALLCLGLQLLDNPVGRFVGNQPTFTFGLLTAGLVLIAFESELLAWLRHLPLCRRLTAKRQAREGRLLEQVRSDTNRALGIVYMSGEDLSFYKLTPELLMSRAAVLRDQLDSGGIRLLSRMHALPDDQTLSRWLGNLYELEKKHDVTLWHPMQLAIAGESTRLRSDSGLNLFVQDAGTREQLLTAWHIRRWLVTMMSTEFVKLVLIAFVIAVPVAWYGMTKWLEGFAYKISVEWIVFALAGIVALAIALITVSFESIKSAMGNPVESLRSE